MSSLLIKLPYIFIVLLAANVGLFAQNEQSPIVEKDLVYKDWTMKGIRDGSDVRLRDLIKGKKLVAVVYYAPWCPNWKHDAPVLERLYEKYKDNGFGVVAVGEYDTTDAMNANLSEFKITFPAVFESFSRDARQTTAHYAYRTATGDTRKWGSPYYIFVQPKAVEKKGDVLLKQTHVINGEMIDAEGEAFIRQKLGLPVEPSKTTSGKSTEQEVCEPDNSGAKLKKPVEKP